MTHYIARTTYGAQITGCSGTEHVCCRRRGTADRIRRVVRAHLLAGGWSGWRTLAELAGLAAARKGRRTTAILQEFNVTATADPE